MMRLARPSACGQFSSQSCAAMTVSRHPGSILNSDMPLFSMPPRHGRWRRLSRFTAKFLEAIDRNFSLQFEADEMETNQGTAVVPSHLLIGQGRRQKILPLRNLGKERLMKQKITLLTYLALPIHLSVWAWTTKILQAMHRLMSQCRCIHTLFIF
jgi:hypothetical protein